MPAADDVGDLMVEILFGAARRWSLADAHALAGILATAVEECSKTGGTLADALGIDPLELRAFLVDGFPGIPLERFGALGESLADLSYEEECLRALLRRFRTGGGVLEDRLASIVARRCRGNSHLWQDLGLSHREELSDLMKTHFAPLAARNSGNMKWKKFLYRMVCLDGNGVCTAPSCSECPEFESCFGEEPGAALIARNQRRPGADPSCS